VIRNVLKLLALLADEIVIVALVIIFLRRVSARLAVIVGGALILFNLFLVKLLWGTLKKKAEVGAEALIGEKAVVVEDLNPVGLVKVKNELWTAECISGTARRGEKVRIVQVKGAKLLVEKDDNAGKFL